MFKALLTGAAALAFTAVPASAATLVVGSGTNTPALADNNDFKAQLTDFGLTTLRTNATLTLKGPANIRVDYFGSESGFTDTFTLGSLSASENNKAWGEQLLGFVTNVASGPLAARFTSDGHSDVHTPGTPNFGFFLPTNNGGDFESDIIWVGYDDQITGPDDDYDDFILRLTVTPVPEPATWAMMISGFGLVGAAARRRASAKVTFA